jgi:hypothetical protein
MYEMRVRGFRLRLGNRKFCTGHTILQSTHEVGISVQNSNFLVFLVVVGPAAFCCDSQPLCTPKFSRDRALVLRLQCLSVPVINTGQNRGKYAAKAQRVSKTQKRAYNLMDGAIPIEVSVLCVLRREETLPTGCCWWSENHGLWQNGYAQTGRCVARRP